MARPRKTNVRRGEINFESGGCKSGKTAVNQDRGDNSLTEAEQNRLVIENAGLVAPIAADYRGRKGIPFEELVAEGMAGLVRAARMWLPIAAFPTYATIKIRSSIVDFIESWEETVSIAPSGYDDRDEEDIFLEWDVWPHAAPYESWVSLPIAPDEIIVASQEIANKQELFRSAMLSLRPRDRAIVVARFIRRPQQKIESIARDHKISHQRVCMILDRAIRKMREIVASIEKSQRKMLLVA